MRMIQLWLAALLLSLSILALSAPAMAQAAPKAAPLQTVSVAPLPAGQTTQPFNADKATKAYLARISGPARAKSNAYFEGGYWLLLADLVWGLAIAAILLFTRASAGMRNWAQSITRSRFLQSALYVVPFTLATAVLSFPLDFYEHFVREHSYGLSNQTFGQWFGEDLTALGLQLIASVIVISIIYAVIRATPRLWWIWGTVVTVLFLAIGIMVSPVLIQPLFNKYTSMPAGPLKSEIVALASANGIPAKDIYVVDASRQSKRISANVSGFAGTTRISLNDNLLHRATRREIRAVMAHEMGHYVLNHSALLLTWLGLVFFAGFAFTAAAFGWVTDIWGGYWNVREISDPAGLPVLIALFSLFTFVATPVQNTIVRTAETQADIFGLNAAREPDGFATISLKLSEYRKLEPSPWEEFIFYDHPSGRSRIHMAMQWKSAHLNDPDIAAGPISPQ